MGLFSSLFSSKRYSTTEKSLTFQEIKKIVSGVRIKSLDKHEECLVEDEIERRRRGDSKVSMQQIYETLVSLQNKHKISKYDKQALMKEFEKHFEKV